MRVGLEDFLTGAVEPLVVVLPLVVVWPLNLLLEEEDGVVAGVSLQSLYSFAGASSSPSLKETKMGYINPLWTKFFFSSFFGI